jgi:hypothetical protein
VSYLWVDCVPGNSAVQCQATKFETGYCAGPEVDVTTTAQWISTNSSVAVSTGSGHFQVQGPGATVILAQGSGGFSMNAFGYRIAASGGIQQIGVVQVEALQKTTGGRVSGATIDFTSATGTQTCQQSGGPSDVCIFWSDFSPAVAQASAPGYTTLQQSVTVTASGNLSYLNGVSLYLTPSP